MQHPVNLCRQTITIKNIHLNVVTNTIHLYRYHCARYHIHTW